MANYIQSSILFQAYVHIDADLEQLGEGDASVREYLHGYLEARAKHFLDPSIDTTLEFKDGSIKAYATVFGTLKSCMPPVIENFVIAINQLFWFTKRLSDAAVMELSFKTNSYLAAIERTEARPGIIGQTKRIVDDFQLLWRPHGDREAAAAARKIKSLMKKVDRLLRVLTDVDEIFLKEQLFVLLKKVPPKISRQQGPREIFSAEYEATYRRLYKMLVS